MSSIELKPCPFCGGEAIISRNDMIIKRKSQDVLGYIAKNAALKHPIT